jgi:hypothetical protein
MTVQSTRKPEAPKNLNPGGPIRTCAKRLTACVREFILEIIEKTQLFILSTEKIQ